MTRHPSQATIGLSTLSHDSDPPRRTTGQLDIPRGRGPITITFHTPDPTNTEPEQHVILPEHTAALAITLGANLLAAVAIPDSPDPTTLAIDLTRQEPQR